MNIFKIESYQKGIAISSFFNIISKIILFINSIVITYYFGTQTKTDIYFYIMSSVIGLIVTLISNMNMTVFIPESMRLRVQVSESSSMNFLNFFLFIYICIAIIITIPFLINSIEFLNLISKFGLNTLNEHKKLINLFIPLFSLILIVNYLTDILTSYKYFTMPMFASIINNSFALFFIIIFHKIYDINSILIGLNLSYLINIIILIFLMKKKLKWVFKFKKISISKKLFNNIIFSQAGSIASFLGSFSPSYMLSNFGSGIITSLNIGQKLANAPSDFISSQFISISGIRFNELHSQRDFKRLNLVFTETAKFLIFILIPLSFIIFIYSDDIVKILFFRGKFDILSVKNTSLFLKYLVLILPLQALNSLAAKIYMAAQLMNYAFWYQIIANTLLIGFTWLFIKNWGILGYPIALLLQYILNIIVVYFFFKALVPYIQYNKVLLYLIFITLINLLISFFIYYFTKILTVNVLNFIYGSLFYIVTLLVINIIFKINYQINYYLNLFIKKFFKKENENNY